jgi:hypothetical protein
MYPQMQGGSMTVIVNAKIQAKVPTRQRSLPIVASLCLHSLRLPCTFIVTPPVCLFSCLCLLHQ